MVSLLPILTFHAIDDLTSVISFSPRVLRRGMARLHERGYRTLSLLEAMDCLRKGKSFPEHSFVITFDDGYRSVFEEAFPVLQQYKMTATVFLAVGKKRLSGHNDRLASLEGRQMLSCEEIREMRSYGIDFGAQPLTHPNLDRLPLERVKAEICDSKKIIEDALGVPVECFAYPYGIYDHRSAEITRKQFAFACSVRLGLVRTGGDLYTLERVEPYYLRSDWLFDMMLTGLFPWYTRTINIPRRLRRALKLGTT